MLPLTPKARRALRAQAHHLNPVVTVGQQGLTPQVLHEIDLALRAHELIKVRVFCEDRREREAMLARIGDELDAAPVQHLGKLLILFRPQEEQVAETKPATPARKRASHDPSARPEVRTSKPAARRARSAPSHDGADATSRRRRSRTGSASSGFASRERSATPGAGRRDGSDAHGRRRTTSGTASARSAASGSAATRGSAKTAPHREPRGKSAPNPRRRRRSTG